MLVAHYANLRIADPKHVREPQTAIMLLDGISGMMILANGLTIGLNSEFSEHQVLQSMDTFFAAFFIVEVVLKLLLHGCRRHFSGPDLRWNCFDAIVAFFFALELSMHHLYSKQVADPDAEGVDLYQNTLLRLARLAGLTRLMRLFRVLRLRVFKELVLMVKGVVAGMRTLAWAIVLLFFIVYIIAVLARHTIGGDRVALGDVYGTVLFSDMMWSMFMIFRILMQDGALPDGTPIAGRLYELYGVGFMLPYMLCLLFAFFGIFNLMTALFVESVMDAAKQKQQVMAGPERLRIAQKLRELILRFSGQQAPEKRCRGVHRSFRQLMRTNPFSVYDAAMAAADEMVSQLQPAQFEYEMEVNISRQMFLEAIRDPRVHALLDDLEVHLSDRSELFDVLDADGSGVIDIGELICGLMKLRSGGTDKSDVVATLLGIRAVQARVKNIEDGVAALAAGAATPAGRGSEHSAMV